MGSSLLMQAQLNCAPAWANHTAGRSTQNGGSRTTTLDISAGDLHVLCILRRFTSVRVDVGMRRDNHVAKSLKVSTVGAAARVCGSRGNTLSWLAASPAGDC
jgi:hypothetical protein